MIPTSLYQIGLPIEELSSAMRKWERYEPRQRIFIYPSQKQADYAVIETRDMRLAADIVRDTPEAKVHLLEQAVRTTTI